MPGQTRDTPDEVRNTGSLQSRLMRTVWSRSACWGSPAVHPFSCRRQRLPSETNSCPFLGVCTTPTSRLLSWYYLERQCVACRRTRCGSSTPRCGRSGQTASWPASGATSNFRSCCIRSLLQSASSGPLSRTLLLLTAAHNAIISGYKLLQACVHRLCQHGLLPREEAEQLVAEVAKEKAASKPRCVGCSQASPAMVGLVTAFMFWIPLSLSTSDPRA
jgi:hypothetical protein